MITKKYHLFKKPDYYISSPEFRDVFKNLLVVSALKVEYPKYANLLYKLYKSDPSKYATQPSLLLAHWLGKLLLFHNPSLDLSHLITRPLKEIFPGVSEEAIPESYNKWLNFVYLYNRSTGLNRDDLQNFDRWSGAIMLLVPGASIHEFKNWILNLYESLLKSKGCKVEDYKDFIKDWLAFNSQ